ncbi:MAG: HEAT repeat domain-containing protein, partial [Planctomycetota bacterium]|nr:HEAT repeat domain-containing protein [Planctomycetota bacterium]
EEPLATTGSSSSWTSLAEVEAIGFAGNKDAITRLSQLATDRKLDKLRREGAVRALGRTEEPSAVAALGAAVVDPEERVANEAAMALGWVKSREATAVLRSRLKAESCGHVMYAVTSLGRIGDLSDARAILEVFDRKDALDSTNFANPRMANVATACQAALADITKTQVTDKNKLFFVIGTPQRLQEVREAWRQKLAPSDPASRPGNGGDGEGLKLQAALAAGAPAEFLPGQAIPFEVQLVNASRTREYTVVKPGDGSESGWREPHVYYTAERLTAEGRWTRLAPAPIGRCGLYDSQWQKDVVTLKPGESLALKEWLPRPSSVFEFQQAGRYRIRVHYSYRGGQAHKGAASRPAEDLGGMKGVEPFEIVSDPVEISVKRPLNVTLKVRGNLAANQPARLSDLLAIAVSNDSDKPISAGQPTLSAEGRLALQIKAELGWAPTLDKQNNPHAARMDLQPGRSVSLLGAGEFANGLDGSWTYPRAGTLKLRAGYTPSTWKDIGTVWSDWVNVKVEPANTSSPSVSLQVEPR